MLRRILKFTVERGMVLSGAPYLARRKRHDETIIFAYHNIVPHGEPVVGDASLHLPQREFARQLDRIQKTHDVIALEELLAGDSSHSGSTAHAPSRSQLRSQLRSQSPARPRAIITFDDAYRGALSAGLDELRTRSLSATMFVAPAYLNGKSFWWDVVTPPHARGLDDALRERALTLDAGKGPKILERLNATSSAVLTRMPPFAQCVTEEELRSALSYKHLTLGSHSWSHPNLTQLNTTELMYELRAPKQWLEERFGDRVVSAISYPYGRANQTVWNAAEAIGYTAGLMIDGGWATLPLPSRYAIPRLNIPSGVSADGFTLRASGIIIS